MPVESACEYSIVDYSYSLQRRVSPLRNQKYKNPCRVDLVRTVIVGGCNVCMSGAHVNIVLFVMFVPYSKE